MWHTSSTRGARRCRPRLGLAGASILVALASCGNDGGAAEDGAPPPGSGPGEEVEVLAIDNVFDPEDAVVEAGTTVVFTNAGRNDHNVIPEDEDAEWVVPTEEFAPGDAASFTFDEPGDYRYFCSIHGTIDVGMIGSITVTGSGTQ